MLSEDEQVGLWNEVAKFLNERFYKPDLEALIIALTAYVAHWRLTNDPIWLFIVGPSGTGKTSIICEALADLEATMMLSDVSPSSFISGLDKRTGGASLLFDLPRFSETRPLTHTHGVLIFKDFTSILSRRPETRAEIIGAMREIADGRYSPRKGTKVNEWQGKVSVIAAATGAVERAWALQRDLGERFVQVRWARHEGLATAHAAMDQLDAGDSRRLKALIKEFAAGAHNEIVALSPTARNELAYAAELTAQLRAHVIHDSLGSKEIIDIPQPEAPTRIVKTLAQIASASARLFGRKELTDADISRARRVARDSIPLNRLRVFNAVHMQSTAEEIAKEIGAPLTSVLWVLDDLLAIGAVQSTGERPRMFDLTPEFERLKTGVATVTQIRIVQ